MTQGLIAMRIAYQALQRNTLRVLVSRWCLPTRIGRPPCKALVSSMAHFLTSYTTALGPITLALSLRERGQKEGRGRYFRAYGLIGVPTALVTGSGGATRRNS